MGHEADVLNGSEVEGIAEDEILACGMTAAAGRIDGEQSEFPHALPVGPGRYPYPAEAIHVLRTRHRGSLAHVHGEILERPRPDRVGKHQPDFLQEDHPPQVHVQPPVVQPILRVRLPPRPVVPIVEKTHIGFIGEHLRAPAHHPLLAGAVLEVFHVLQRIRSLAEPAQLNPAVVQQLDSPHGNAPGLPLALAVDAEFVSRTGPERQYQNR